MKYDIFISYRHKGGVDKARILTQHFCAIGYKVFFDHEECSEVVGGFDTKILGAIEVAPIFLIVLTSGCFDECHDESNWVRREIEHAIKCNKPIIPIVIAEDLFEFDSLPDSTPETIMSLKNFQFSHISFEVNFKSTITELVEKIKRVVAPSIATANKVAKGATIHFFSDISCRVFQFGKQIAITDAVNENNDSSIVKLPKGRHRLEYKSIENDSDSYTEILSVYDNDMEDFVEIKLQNIKEERLKKEGILRQQEDRKAAQEKAREKEVSDYEYDFFFTYSNKDALMVRLVKDHLETAGYTCWAQSFSSDANDVLTNSQCILYFHSEHSRHSQFIFEELAIAKKDGKCIKIIHLDDSPCSYKMQNIIGNTTGVKLHCREDMQHLCESLL